MVLIAMPSFGGRAPDAAIERRKQILGNGACCTLVCVYGNRAYGDTRVQMENAARESGFQVIAAVAAVAEHSIMPQYAAGRPDASDQKQLTEFTDRIAGKAEVAPMIPGTRPYKKQAARGLYRKYAKPVQNADCAQKNAPCRRSIRFALRQIPKSALAVCAA